MEDYAIPWSTAQRARIEVIRILLANVHGEGRWDLKWQTVNALMGYPLRVE